MVIKLMLTPLLLLLLLSSAIAQTENENSDSSGVVDTLLPEEPPPAPATNVKAVDLDNDHGHAIYVSWDISADDGNGTKAVSGYEIFKWQPTMLASLDDQRVLINIVVAARSNFPGELIKAEKSLSDLEEGEDFTTLIFEVAQPDDSGFVLTEAFVKSALQDTITFISEKLPFLRDSIRVLNTQLDTFIDELPDAYAKYPENGAWVSITKVASGVTEYTDSGSKDYMSGAFSPDFTDFYYRVDALTSIEGLVAASLVFGPVQSSGQWFNTDLYPVAIAVLLFAILTMWFVSKARRGDELYVRPLAGIEAVDDAIGRATEMGRPILYILGLGSASDVATIASFTILGRVSKKVAEYQTPLMVPTYDPIVMSVAQEVVKSSYLDAGRPDDYNENIVHFVTNLQFAYVAAVNGMMLRERPATNIYMGKFFAESLILAETGALAGSIQIAGTDEIAQIPFFIVACDYTLIGEELYAASAYLGREPILLGSLKAQDWAKMAIIFFAFTGLIAATFGWTWYTELFRVAN